MKNINDYQNRLNRDYTPDEIMDLLKDKNIVLGVIEVSKIADYIFPVDYKDTFIVPESEAEYTLIESDGTIRNLGKRKTKIYGFRGKGILANGKYDIAKTKVFDTKVELTNLLLKRNKINRVLSGEPDSLDEPLTSQIITEYERELELTQEGVLKAVEPYFCLSDKTIQTDGGKPTEGNKTANNGALELPAEIDTPEAKKVIEKAIKKGYIEKAETGYRWIKTKLECAYFAYTATIRWDISKKIDSKGEKCCNWKPFEQYFRIKKLSEAKANYMRLNTRFEPTCKMDIDSLFE